MKIKIVLNKTKDMISAFEVGANTAIQVLEYSLYLTSAFSRAAFLYVQALMVRTSTETSGYAQILKLSPQPHVPLMLGLLKTNSLESLDSTKSISVPKSVS